MELSLDDYISIKERNNTNSNNYDAVESERYGRSERRNDSDDVLMINDAVEKDFDDVEIWSWRSTTTNSLGLDCQNNEQQNINTEEPSTDADHSNIGYDLRGKLTGSNRTEMPYMNSQNWRMMRPNINCQRPAGMPPLVSQNAQQMKRSNQKNRNYFRRNKKRAKFNNGFSNYGQNAYNREQKNHIWAMQQPFNNRQNENTTVNITIPMKEMTAAKRTQTIMPQLGENSNTAFRGDSPTSQLNLYGLQSHQEINNAMLPQIASKMLDMIRNISVPVAHKPIYDLTIHKEICDIQKKPFIYKCGSAGVVSSDGPGIDNLKILPAITPLSMNCRFG